MIFHNAKTILDFATKSNITLKANENNLIVEAPKGLITDEFKKCLLENKAAIIFTLNHHGVSEDELKQFLRSDWDDYKDNPEALIAWSDLLVKNRLIDQGIPPSNFTAITLCNTCGEVLVPPELANDGHVLGCPWCFNRAKGKPIPRK